MQKINSLLKLVEISPAKLTGLKYAPKSRAIEPVKDSFQRCCECVSHYDESRCMVFGTIPKDYITTKQIWMEAEPERISRFGKREKIIPATPARWETYEEYKPCYKIEHLFSHVKGQGKEAVKNVVLKSLQDTRTNGRVILQADIIDGKTSPAGFYYKMGFRSTNHVNNLELEEWLKSGGKRENAPMLTGMMYLPKENIEHCLNY